MKVFHKQPLLQMKSITSVLVLVYHTFILYIQRQYVHICSYSYLYLILLINKFFDATILCVDNRYVGIEAYFVGHCFVFINAIVMHQFFLNDKSKHWLKCSVLRITKSV